MCICVITTRRSSTARHQMSLPPMRPSSSTSSSTTRHPCGGPQSVSVRFTNLFTVQSLYPTSQSSYFCHPSASLSIYLYISLYIYTYKCIIQYGITQVFVRAPTMYVPRQFIYIAQDRLLWWPRLVAGLQRLEETRRLLLHYAPNRRPYTCTYER